MTSVPALETETRGCHRCEYGESRIEAFAFFEPGSNQLRDAARSASSTMCWSGISYAGDISVGLDPILNALHLVRFSFQRAVGAAYSGPLPMGLGNSTAFRITRWPVFSSRTMCTGPPAFRAPAG